MATTRRRNFLKLLGGAAAFPMVGSQGLPVSQGSAGKSAQSSASATEHVDKPAVTHSRGSTSPGRAATLRSVAARRERV
jgi:hypothetical protein